MVSDTELLAQHGIDIESLYEPVSFDGTMVGGPLIMQVDVFSDTARYGDLWILYRDGEPVGATWIRDREHRALPEIRVGYDWFATACRWPRVGPIFPDSWRYL